MGTTGDMKNNLRKLQGELKLIRYTSEVDYEKMMVGLCAPFLPLLHHVFTEYSPQLSSYFSSKGYDLYAKSDLRFLEIIYKILVQEMETKPMLTKQQFFAIGYAEMKVIFTTKIISLCRLKLESLTKKTKKKKRPSVSSLSKISADEYGSSQTGTISNEMSRRDSSTHGDELASDLGVEIERPPSVTLSARGESEEIHTVLLNQQQHKKEKQPQPEISVFQPPLPNPILALTPIKSISTNKPTLHRDGEKNELDMYSLDITEDMIDDDDNHTEVGDESFVETNDVEIVEPDDVDTMAVAPQFKITKHTTVSHVVKGPSNISYLPSLPGNITVDSSRERSHVEPSCSQCPQCLTNSKTIESLVEKQQVMENDVYNLVSVNNDLSAKILLLETKVKLMESANGSKNRNESLSTVVSSNELGPQSDNDANVDEDTNTDSVVAVDHLAKESGRSHAVELLNKRTAAVSPASAASAQNTYSPIKYTDDDIIIKDFKPIRMKDVYQMLQQESEDKENASPDDHPTSSCVEKPIRAPPVSNQKVSRELQPQLKALHGNQLPVKIRNSSISSSESGKQDLNNVDSSRTMLSDSCDVSLLFDDDATEEAVLNVRKKLQETENMLRNSGNYFAKK